MFDPNYYKVCLKWFMFDPNYYKVCLKWFSV